MKVTLVEREEKVVEVITLKVGKEYYYRHEDWECNVNWYDENGSEIHSYQDEMYGDLESWLIDLVSYDFIEGSSINVKKAKR